MIDLIFPLILALHKGEHAKHPPASSGEFGPAPGSQPLKPSEKGFALQPSKKYLLKRNTVQASNGDFADGTHDQRFDRGQP